MRRKSKFLVALLFVLLLVACESAPEENDLLQIASKSGQDIDIRIKAYKQRPSFGLTGVDYYIDWKPQNENDWSAVFKTQHDDGIKFGEDNIIFLKPLAAFIFIVRQYALTEDGGKTWRIKTLQNDPTCLIDNVTIDAHGYGTMRLKCNRQFKVLSTLNYGDDWAEPDK